MGDFASEYQGYRQKVDDAQLLREMEQLIAEGPEPAAPGGAGGAGEPGGGGAMPQGSGVPDGQTTVERAHGAPQEGDRSVVSRAGDVLSDIAVGVRELPRQAIGGMIDAAKEVGDLSVDAIDAIGEAIPDWLKVVWFAGSPYGTFSENDKQALQRMADNMAAEVGRPAPDVRALIAEAKETGMDIIPSVDDAESTTGGLIRATTQFLTGFLPLNRLARGAGAPAVVSEMMAGGAASGMVFDPQEGRLSTFLNEVPVLAGIVPDYLADVDPANEPQWENRLRNVIEEAGLAGFGQVLLKTFRVYKAQRASKVAEHAGSPAERRLEAEAEVEQARAEISQDIPADALAGLGDASPNAPLLAQGDIEATAAQVFMQDRAGRAAVELRERLPEGYSTQQLKGSVGIFGPDGKRIATVKVPQAVSEDYLANIAKRVNEVEGLKAIMGAVQQAEAVRPGVDAMDELLNAVRGGVKSQGPKYPVLGKLKSAGGVDPNSILADELRALGVSNRTMPGIFRKEGGLTAADTFEAGDPIFEGRFSPSETGGDFIPEETILEGVQNELAGNPWRSPEIEAEAEALGLAVDDLSRALDEMGLDVNTLDNHQIKAAIREVEQEAERFRARLEGPEGEGVGLTEAEAAMILPGEGAAAAGAPAKHHGKVYLNLARINSSDDVRAALAQMVELDADAIKAKTGGTMSEAEMLKLSRQEFQNIEDLLNRKPGPMSAAEAIAARKLLTASGEQLVQLAKKAAAPDASKADVYAFRRAMSVHYAIQSEVVAARTETARALRSWAVPASTDRMRGQMIEELISRGGGPADLVKMAKGVASLADNPTGLNHIVERTVKGKIGRAFYEVWINGLLSSPKTHLVNITSNTLTGLWAIPERYIAAAYSQAFGEGSIQFAEAAALSYGWAKGWRDGFLLVAKGEKSKELEGVADLFEQFGKVDLDYERAVSGKTFGQEGAFGTAIDYLGAAINVPTTLLGKEDALFKAIGYRMELQSRAYRMAAGEGLEGEAMAKRMAEILADPPEDLVADALDVAHYQTFTNALGPTGNIGMAYLNRVPGARLVLPFIRTPTNILKYTFARTPLAFASKRVRADLAAGGPRAAQAMARITLGSAAMMTFADYASEGLITGAGPSNPDVREAWLRTHQPYSIKVGDQWVQYNRLDPIGLLMGFGADMQEIITYGGSDEDSGRLVASAAVAFAQNMANKTYLSGLYEFIAAADPRNPTSDPAKFLTRFAGSILPYSSIVRATAQASDPVLRDTRVVEGDPGVEYPQLPAPVAEFLQSALNEARAGIPGLSDTLPAKRNLWGEVRTRESELGIAYDFASPLRVQSVEDDPLDLLLIDNRIRVSMPQRQMEGVPLTAEEYWDFVEMAGKPAKLDLDRLIKSPGFGRLSNGPEGGKAEVIKARVDVYRRAARAQLLAKYPELRERIAQERLRRQQKRLGL